MHLRSSGLVHKQPSYKHSLPELETVLCRPFYLLRELTVVLVTTVYIPPNANVSLSLSLLCDMQRAEGSPQGPFIMAGDRPV